MENVLDDIFLRLCFLQTDRETTETVPYYVPLEQICKMCRRNVFPELEQLVSLGKVVKHETVNSWSYEIIK